MSYFDTSHFIWRYNFIGIVWLISAFLLFDLNFKLFNRHLFNPLYHKWLTPLNNLWAFRRLIQVSFEYKPLLNIFLLKITIFFNSWRNFTHSIELLLLRDILVRLNYDDLFWSFLILISLIFFRLMLFGERYMWQRSPIILVFHLNTLLRLFIIFLRCFLPLYEFTRGFVFRCENLPLRFQIVSLVNFFFLLDNLFILYIMLFWFPNFFVLSKLTRFVWILIIDMLSILMVRRIVWHSTRVLVLL